MTKNAVAAILSMVEPNPDIFGTVGWTRFAGKVEVADAVEEGDTKAYYIFEIKEGSLKDGTVLQYYHYTDGAEGVWLPFADEGDGKYRFGDSNGFDLAKVDGVTTEFQAKISGESITGAAYLIDAKTKGIISNKVETTLVANPLTEQDVAIAAIKPSWAQC